MDKDFEWGYREAEVGDVGSQIEVGSDENGWQYRELVAVLPVGMLSRFVCRAKENPRDGFHWNRSRVRYRLPYGERQAKCGIGVGDFVKMLRVPLEHEDGWECSAVPSSMIASVGKVFEVSKVDPDSGFFLKDDWWYPYFVLEKVEKPALPKVRTVADLVDGEVFCTDEGRWFQANYEGDHGSNSMNKPEEDCGWVVWGVCHLSCRRARLLRAPTMGAPAIGEMVFHVSNPSERFKVWFVFSDGTERAVVHRGEDYRVFKLADLRS